MAESKLPRFNSMDALLSVAKIIDNSGALTLSPDAFRQFTVSSPAFFKFSNPLAMFPCDQRLVDQIAISVAAIIYFISGTKNVDFMELTTGRQYLFPANAGHALRFQGINVSASANFDFAAAERLRQKGGGFTDQLESAIVALNSGEEDVVLQFTTAEYPLPVHQAWLYTKEDRLNMNVYFGCVDVENLIYEWVPIFSFLLHLVADLTKRKLGSIQFFVGKLYGGKLALSKIPTVYHPRIDLSNIHYPAGGRDLKDINTLVTIMSQYLHKLDASSINRVNPFVGDESVVMWSDFAEVLRMQKAKNLGILLKDELVFHHPYLRYAYTGEAV